MSRRVLVPVDGSEMATRALEYALDVHPDGEVTLLFVVGEPSPMMGRALSVTLEEDYETAAQDLAEEVFGPARKLAAEHGVDVETEIGMGSPAREIVEHAADHDVVVLGSHSGSLRDRLFVGNVAGTVVRRLPVPVTVVR